MTISAPVPRAAVGLVMLALLAMLGSGAPAQDWTDEQLTNASQGFLQAPLVPRLRQMATLLGSRNEAIQAMAARIHGDHREYLLKIERLLGELSNDRWAVREQAERSLIEVGARARAMIQQRAENSTTLEEGLRCKRILEALTARGTQNEEREIKILRGLVMTAAQMDTDPRLLRAFRSALGHTDPLVVDAAIRALGSHGGDEEASAVLQMLEWKGGIHRSVALQALPRMQGDKALQICRGLVQGGKLSTGETVTMVRNLRLRADVADLLTMLQQHRDPTTAKAAALPMPQATAPATPIRVKLTLTDRSALETGWLGLVGDALLAERPIEELEQALLPLAECEILDFPGHAPEPGSPLRVFLNQGSLVSGELESIDPESIRMRSPVFGRMVLPRDKVQGLAMDAELDRLLGGSTDHDRLRLKTNQFLDGKLLRATPGEVVIATREGERKMPSTDIAGILLKRPRLAEQDPTIYTRVDLTSGDRILGFLSGSSRSHLALSAPDLGAVALPMTKITHVEMGVGGGALWGFTLVADYSENKIVEVDDQGREVFVMTDVYGVWDAECLDNGNLLITEFSVSRVREVTRKGETVWTFEDLKNPYDADRLQNGNTLIADTFNGRVIEVNAQKEIVWKFDADIRPFDCDRLPNGNTLIADASRERVIEVSPQCEVVWEAKGMNQVHDADRLPNGNTLITLRLKGLVIEVDKDGKIVWQLGGLNSPSDADRLPNGNTVVAENNQVREFDRHGNVVWRKEMVWAVEVNRY